MLGAFAIAMSVYLVLFAEPAASESKLGPADALPATALATKENVIVIIPDGFTGFRLFDVFATHRSLSRSFEGFTFYPNAIASAGNTIAGISAILTGDLDIAIDVKSKRDRLRQSIDRSFLSDALRKGYDVAIVSKLGFDDANIFSMNERDIGSIRSNSYTTDLIDYSSFLTLSLRRIVPSGVHDRIDSLVTRLIGAMDPTEPGDPSSPRKIVPAHQKYVDAKSAFNYLLDNMHAGGSERKVLFWHTNMTHNPFVFDENGNYNPKHRNHIHGTATFMVKRIARFLNKLKEMGLYGRSLIVVVSDHGGMGVRDRSYGGQFAPEQALHDFFNPLLLVKPPGAEGGLRLSKMTVWLGDVAETMRDQLDVPGPDKRAYAVRSLLSPGDDGRRLDVPLFWKPDDAGWHDALATWPRRAVSGDFRAYGPASRAFFGPRLRKFKIPCAPGDKPCIELWRKRLEKAE